MEQVSGSIENMAFKEGDGKYGKWEKVSIQVQGEWYGAFKKPENSAALDSLAKGDEVEVFYELDKTGKFRNLVDVKTVSKSAVPPAQAAAQSSASVATATAVGVNHSQYRMSHAGGRNAAVGLITAALAHDSAFDLSDKDNRILSLPKAQNKRLDVLTALVETLGNKFASQNWLAEPVVEDEDNGYEE